VHMENAKTARLPMAASRLRASGRRARKVHEKSALCGLWVEGTRAAARNMQLCRSACVDMMLEATGYQRLRRRRLQMELGLTAACRRASLSQDEVARLKRLTFRHHGNSPGRLTATETGVEV
jgi:hypothetical protein